MYKLHVIFVVLLISELNISRCLFLEDSSETCSYTSTIQKKNIHFRKKVYEVQINGLALYFTLCGNLSTKYKCGLNVSACLTEHNTNCVIGKEFILANNNTGLNDTMLKTINGDRCKTNPTENYKLTIKFECYDDIKEIRMEKVDPCEYVVYMIHPKCELPCTVKINNQLIDLRKLKGNYQVTHEEDQFSIALCKATSNCTEYHGNVTICKKSKSTILPLSSYSNEKMDYNAQKNIITFHGSYEKNKFELTLKCNWDDNSTQITYIKTQKQGKEYQFFMSTSYGCVKFPPKCVINDAFLKYNLTNLYRYNGYLVSNYPNGNLYLNICGFLDLKFKTGHICSKSFSQVCEVNNGNYINWGSILSNFEIVNDVIKVTYTNGMRCDEEPSDQYSTHIDLICSKIDTGPKFIAIKGCNLFITWSTPEACPEFDALSCNYKQESQDCSLTFQDWPLLLDSLPQLNKTFEIGDRQNKSIKYFLNICQPITDPDATCIKHSMIIMKDINQPNIKYRTKSLGKLDTISITSNGITIKAVSGTYCGGIEGDYVSTLYLICSNKQELPQLVNKTKCSFQFEWRTPQWCMDKKLEKHSIYPACIVKDTSDYFFLNFAKVKHTSIIVNLTGTTYKFDFCKETYMKCLNGQCEDKHLTKHLRYNNSSIFLEMLLSTECNTENVINEVIFELICDEVVHNEHFVVKNRTDCTVNILLYTNIVCDRKKFEIDNVEEYVKYDILKNNNSFNSEGENCSVTNDNTGYSIDLSSLDINLFLSPCPTTTFYEHNTSVLLISSSARQCNTSLGKVSVRNMTILKCSNEHTSTVTKQSCSQIHYLQDPEFCKLFDLSVLEVPQKIVTVISLVTGIVLLGGVCFLVYKKNWLKKTPYIYIYEKDSDL